MSMALKEVKLHFIEGENEGIEIRLEVPREVVIGRGEDCDIYLGEKKISRRHAKLITTKSSLIIEDMKSTNGTFVNGKRLNGKETLANEDSVRIGTSVFKIDFIADEGRANADVSQSGRRERMISAASGNSSSVPSLLESGAELPSAEASMDAFGNIDIEAKMRESESSSKPIPKKRPPEPPPAPDEPSVDIDLNFASNPKPIKAKISATPELEMSEVSMDSSSGIDIILDAEPPPPPPKRTAAPPPPPPPAVAPAAAKRAAKGGLVGNLSALPLSDLLQTFTNGNKTGMLKLNGPVKGQIYLQEGKITYAFLEQGITGPKAFYRMISWREADFELVPLPEQFSPPKSLGQPLESSTENLLMEGYRQLDEMDNLKKSLPPLDQSFGLNPKMDNPLSKLHPRVLDVVQLIIKLGQLGKVIDASGASDLDTAKMIFYLIKKGYIVEV